MLAVFFLYVYQLLYFSPALINKVIPAISPTAKAIKLYIECVLEMIIPVIRRPLPIKISPCPVILQKTFLLSGETFL